MPYPYAPLCRYAGRGFIEAAETKWPEAIRNAALLPDVQKGFRAHIQLVII